MASGRTLEIVSIKNDIEATNKNQSEMKIAIPKMKNSLKGINSGLDGAEQQISE